MISGMTSAGVHGIGMTSQRTRDRLVQRLRNHGISNESVLSAIASVPRHLFIDEALATRAYEDTALPIGLGQTISQPYVVALMTQALLDAQPMDKVLEVGTGSGYQAAVLAQLVKQVFFGGANRRIITQLQAPFSPSGYPQRTRQVQRWL